MLWQNLLDVGVRFTSAKRTVNGVLEQDKKVKGSVETHMGKVELCEVWALEKRV